jgi:hypothetical protein
MLLRDGPGFAVHFATFGYLKTQLKVGDQDRIHENYNGLTDYQVAFRKFIAGGLTGIVTYSFAFPLDTVKTNMQA